MPVYEAPPTSTTVIAAGWDTPTNGYAFNGSYTYSETDDAEQEYDGYTFPLQGAEVIDKVFVKIKDLRNVTTVAQGDAASFEGSVKVYDGSSWTTYQVTADDFAVSTANDEDLTNQSGDASNTIYFLDVTSTLNTVAKLNSAKTRILFNISATAAGITLRWSVDAITLLVCYHTVGDVFIGASSATTRQDAKKREHLAVKRVADYLRAT